MDKEQVIDQCIKSHPLPSDYFYEQINNKQKLPHDEVTEDFHKEVQVLKQEQLEINKYCLDIASKLPNTCLKELFDNANKIKEYLEGK